MVSVTSNAFRATPSGVVTPVSTGNARTVTPADGEAAARSTASGSVSVAAVPGRSDTLPARLYQAGTPFPGTAKVTGPNTVSASRRVRPGAAAVRVTTSSGTLRPPCASGVVNSPLPTAFSVLSFRSASPPCAFTARSRSALPSSVAASPAGGGGGGGGAVSCAVAGAAKARAAKERARAAPTAAWIFMTISLRLVAFVGEASEGFVGRSDGFYSVANALEAANERNGRRLQMACITPSPSPLPSCARVARMTAAYRGSISARPASIPAARWRLSPQKDVWLTPRARNDKLQAVVKKA